MSKDTNKDYDKLREYYAEWLATPLQNRDCKTKTALAKRIGVARKTLYRWEEREGFKERVWHKKKAKVSVEDFPKVMDAIIHRASATEKTMDWKAANKASEIFLEWIGNVSQNEEKGALADLVRFTEMIKDDD